MDRLEKILRNLGVDEQQAMVYSELSKNGPATILELATRIGMKRPTVHFHVEQLLEKKLLTESLRSGRRTLVACGHEVLQDLVKKKIAEAENTGAMLSDMMEELDILGDIEKANSVAFSVEEGVDAVLAAYRDALNAPEVLSYFNVYTGGKIADIRSVACRGVKNKDFSFAEYGPEGPAVEMKGYHWYTFTHSNIVVRGPVANVLIYGQKVAIISVYEHGHIRVLSIQQPALTEVIRGFLKN